MPWTITGGSATINFTSMLDFEVNDQSSVTSFLIEEGSFANYNKTDEPLRIKATLAIQGNDATKEAALSAVKQLKNSLDLVSLETPEACYESLNIENYNYMRSAETGPLVIQLELIEVRQVVGSATTSNNTTNCKNATSCDTANTGNTNTVDAGTLSKRTVR